MQQIYRGTLIPKCDFSKVACNLMEITLRYGCSPVNLFGCSPVNLLHIFSTPFPNNNSGELLLKFSECCFCSVIFFSFENVLAVLSLLSCTRFFYQNDDFVLDINMYMLSFWDTHHDIKPFIMIS